MNTYRLIFRRHSVVSKRFDQEEHDTGAEDGETAANPEGACSALDRAGATEICAVFKLRYQLSSHIPTNDN